MTSPINQAGLLAPLFFVVLLVFFMSFYNMPNNAVQAGGKIFKNISKKFNKSKNK